MNRKIIYIFILLVFSCLLSYKAGQHANQDISPPVIEQADSEPPVSAYKEQNLRITVKPDNLFTVISAEELHHNVSHSTLFHGVKDVSIEIENEIYPLELAIRDNLISTAMLHAYAQQDAKNGLCSYSPESQNGLTQHIYGYPDFDIKFVYDIYETPDGQQHLINDISIYKKGGVIPRYYVSHDRQLIDREDWGLQFTVIDATASNLTLNCQQSAGQQIGELKPTYYYIISAQNNDIDSLKTNKSDYWECPPIILQDECCTRLTIDWTETYGELPAGEYTLWLQVEDFYNKEDIHPLMQNFYDAQDYWIEFSIE